MSTRPAPLALILLCLSLLLTSPHAQSVAPATRSGPSEFAARIAALSEPGGYFDTDNLISNERSYLHVMPELSSRGIRGGAYLGVGPDQNYSYIARVRPTIAFLVDIRRDNLLLHLLFKGLFTLAQTRAEYLALLTGRAATATPAAWGREPIDAIVAHIDQAAAPTAAEITAVRARVNAAIEKSGVPLSATDRATIDRFHRQFISAGLSLQFTSTGRPPQRGYPTYRDLLLEVDTKGVRQNFLASDADFQFLKTLTANDLMIPVVGDLSGTLALGNLAKFLTARGESVSAFYTSNVEFYLFRAGTFANFVGNLSRLPRRSGAVIIRSVFGGAGTPLAGYNSAQLLQPIQDLVNGYAMGRFRDYYELTVR